MIQRQSGRWASLLAVLALAGCHSTSTPNPTSSTNPTSSAPSAPMVNQPGALFYSKAGSLYVSQPAGSPGRKLTDGPADSQPAPSPGLSRVAFVRKAKTDDYGGELWVLDLSPELEPTGPPRRLVDPAALVHGSGGLPPMVASPRWSPTGHQVAFVDNPTGGAVSGGVLLVAAADTGALAPRPSQPPDAAWAPFAGPDFAWAPDGGHIVWLNERSDVRPVDVNVLTVGGASTPVVSGTNAFSVTYAKDGKAILFTNGDATQMGSTPEFALRTGGIYSVASDKPDAKPAPLFVRRGSYYSDLTALSSDAMAFTAQGATETAKAIQVLDKGSSLPRTIVTDVTSAAQGPIWGVGDFVAYLDTSPETSLVVTDLDNRSPKRVDTGVDSFAWAP
jgi:TolB protein